MSQISNHRKLLIHSLLLLLLTFHGFAQVKKTHAAEKQTGLRAVSNEDLVEALRKAKVVDASFNLSALKNGDEIIITTERSPKFSDDEVKVQAVLIAKTAFDLLPQNIERTKILFQNKGQESFCKILVNRPLVNSYGRGEIKKQSLISSLELEQEQDSGKNTLSVVPGPRQDDRLLQLSNINYLKAKGGDLKSAEELFAAQEKSAQKGDSIAVNDSLKKLWVVIKEQRAALDAAKRSGVTLVQTKSKNPPEPQEQQGSTKPFVKGTNLALILFLRSQKIDVSKEQDLLIQSRQKDTMESQALRKQIYESLMLKFKKLPQEVQSKFSLASFTTRTTRQSQDTSLEENQQNLKPSIKTSNSTNQNQQSRSLLPYTPNK